jgi:RNA-binding protein YhbY
MDVPFGIQVAQEGHREPQVAHGVRLAHRVVNEIERAAVQREVVKSELRRLARRLVGRRCELFENVVDVVAATPQVGEPGHGPVHRDGVHHRRHPHQGLQFPIHIDTLDPHLVRLAVGRGNGQVGQGELHRPGLEVHSPQGHRAPELLAGDLLGLVPEQRRHRQPAEHPQGQHPGNGPRGAARPFVTLDCLQVHGRISVPASKTQWCHGCQRLGLGLHQTAS